MKGKGFGVEILSHAAHLDCELGVAWSPVGVRGSEEGNGIVSFLQD